MEVDGVLVAIAIAVCGLCFAAGQVVSSIGNAKSCDTFGAFESSGVVYQCSKKEPK